MPINWSRLRSLTTRELLGALERDGFFLHRQSGSHMHYKHDDGRRVSVPFHGSGITFRLGLLRLMIQVQAKWTEEDLRRLGLL